MKKRPERLRRFVEPEITLSEEGGVRFLHFDSPWIQGAMRLRSPDWLELEYLQRMMAWLLFVDEPARMLQIGVGAGSLVRFCHRYLKHANVTAVDVSERVLSVARHSFGLPPEGDRLQVVNGDGAAWVAAPASRGRYGVIAVDAFDAAALGPVLDSAVFYADCRRALAPAGILVTNLFGSERSLGRNRARISRAFDGRFLELALPGLPNVIALAFSGPPLEVTWESLRARAAVLERRYRLPASIWVRALERERGGSGASFSV